MKNEDILGKGLMDRHIRAPIAYMIQVWDLEYNMFVMLNPPWGLSVGGGYAAQDEAQ